MLIAAHEKKQHPEYQEYVENFEATLTGLEAGLRGGGNPGLIVDKCLDIARSFYDCDSAALVETNLELGYGVCVSEHCKEGVVSYEGRVINVTAEETPYLQTHSTEIPPIRYMVQSGSMLSASSIVLLFSHLPVPAALE